MNYFKALWILYGYSKQRFWNKVFRNNIFDTNLRISRSETEIVNDRKNKRLAKLSVGRMKQKALKRFGLELIPSGLQQISKNFYDNSLIENPNVNSNENSNLIYDAVVEYRKFEIELYWKRATYFWAFIVSIFATIGFLVKDEGENEYPVFLVLCVGIIVSNAWYYSNIGSKFWQRHWEKHLDLIEDGFTGPLYKTVFERRSYSVSKINLIVSNAFRFVFVALVIFFFIQSDDLGLVMNLKQVNLGYLVTFIITLIFVLSMKLGQGRGRFRQRSMKIYRRNT